MLSANDGVHAIAYDAVNVSVAAPLTTTAVRGGNSIELTWNGSAPNSVIEQSLNLPAQWTPILTASVRNASIPMTNVMSFFRIREP